MKSFTLVELISTIAILALLLAVMVPVVGNYVKVAKQTSDKQTLAVLNDALTRYKTQGGDIDALTAGASIANVLDALQTSREWCGVTHQVLSSGVTYSSASLDTAGSGAQFKFTRYGTYDSAETSGGEVSSPLLDSSNYLVSTFAGSTNGSADGTGEAAQFFAPYGAGMNGSGYLYIGDTGNQRIRRINPFAVVATLAGSTYGYATGTGTSVKFATPIGLDVDDSGYIYVADSGNHLIRKISPGGSVTNFAGTATSYGYVDDAASFSKFYSPNDVAVDSSGYVYVADTYNSRIRKIEPGLYIGGAVTTLAGSGSGYADGTGTGAQFNRPQGIAIDTSGNLYVADTNNHRIRKITPAGVVTTLAGSTSGYADGEGSSAQFASPMDVEVDSSGNVYVTDTSNHRIRVITPDGVVGTVAGGSSGYANGTGTDAQFSSPAGIALDDSGSIYVVDSGNHRIRKIVLQVQ